MDFPFATVQNNEEPIEQNPKNRYNCSDHEEVSIMLIDFLHELGNLQKKRKKDTKCLDIVADQLAEMFRGSPDLDLLHTLIEKVDKAHSKLLGLDDDQVELEVASERLEVNIVAEHLSEET